MHLVILGDGPLARAVAAAAGDRGDRVDLLGRPADGRHARGALDGADVVVDASRGDAVVQNLKAVLDAGRRSVVIATTGWPIDLEAIDDRLRSAGAAAVSAANFSIGAVLFGRLVEAAGELFGAVDEFEPFLVEWHRRSKADRPSGTALDLARRLTDHHRGLGSPSDLETVSIRAGASPGMHLIGFDAPGETVELRLTARDRTAYAAGILAAADWLVRTRPAAGRHPFHAVVDDLLAQPVAA